MFYKANATTSALLSVDDLRNKYGFHFNKEQEAYFSSMILTAQRACADYMDVDSLALTSCSEELDLAENQTSVVLSGTPFVEITAVFLDGEAVTGYSVDSRSHVVYLPESTAKKCKVEYKIGYSKVPEDVLYCIAMTVQSMARMANASLMGKNSQSTDGGSETYEQSVVPLAVRTYLDRIRNGRLA